MIRDILIWPDDVLLQVSAPVETIDDEVRTLVDDMFETMYDADGVGLAAPQVGVLKRILVVDIHGQEDDRPSGEPPIVMINPEFLEKDGALAWEEGCLSIPGETGEVTRAAHVKLKYQDLDGAWHELEAEGLTAVALQHEYDHLDGKLFVNYLSKLKQKVIRRKMNKLRADRDAGR